MIQDIAPHQFKNEYRPVFAAKGSIALYYEEHTALMRRTQTGIEFPTFGELERLNEEIYENSIYLFTIDEKQYYLVDNLNREPHSEFYNGEYGDFQDSRSSVQRICGDHGISAVSMVSDTQILWTLWT